ncbi:MAG: hypothetical protein Q9217_002427 [Psora testacea]
MAENQPPKASSPEGIPRRPLAPGPNSWAQSHQRQQSAMSDKEEPRPTNRDRYENKPMPKIPSEATGQTSVLQPKTYIQPAIPLVGPAPIPKKRAVTDPIAPKPLFASQKPSVTQLRKVFSHSKHGSEDDNQLSPGFEYPTGKAAEVLGLTPVLTGFKRSTAPSSAPKESSNAHHTYDSSDASSRHPLTATCQVQSSPVPACRHVGSGSDHDPATDVNITPDSKKHQVLEQVLEEVATPMQPHRKQSNAHLQPPKIATYGRVGEVGIVQNKGLYRVESFQGIIESASSPVRSEEQSRAKEDGQTAPRSAALSQHNEQFLQTKSHSSNYGGVWENNPAVVSFKSSALPSWAEINHVKGYSLPQFSPMPKGCAQYHATDAPLPTQTSAVTTPSVFGDIYTDASLPGSGQGSAQHSRNGPLAPHNAPRFAEYQPPLGSANSWASGSRYNSFAPENAPVSALLPPLWPHHHLSNSVPSPPHTRQDYQRPDPLSAGLSQLDMTIHHHIDTAFGALSRLVTDKHDRMLDHVIRRLEDLEDGLGKSFKHIKSNIKGLNSEVGRVKATIHSFNAGHEGIKGLMHGLEGKLGVLEQQIEENKRQCQQIMKALTINVEGDRQSRSSTHRRTESAHGILDTSRDRHKEQNGMSRASSKARISNTSSRGHRSNTVNSQTNGRVSDDRGSKREYFADLGAARGPVPDIREHPAYSGVPLPPSQMYDQNGVPIGMASTASVPYGAQQLGDGAIFPAQALKSLINKDIQQKRYRPSAIWKRVDDSDPRALYSLPISAETLAAQDHHLHGDVPIAVPLVPTGTVTIDKADGRPRIPDNSELPSQNQDEAHTKIVSVGSTASETRAAAPRRFHLSKVPPANFLPHPPFAAGIQKNKHHRKVDQAMFIEKARGNRTSVKAQSALEAINGDIKIREQDTKANVQAPPPRKRPIITPAENARKATARVTTAQSDQQNKMPKTGNNIDKPSYGWDYDSEELAAQLHAIALEQTEGSSPSRHANLKFPPKPPKPRQQATPISVTVGRCPTVLDTEEGDTDLDVGYVYETYVRVASPGGLKSLPIEGPIDPVQDITEGRIGVLVIEEGEEALWETFGVDEESDPEWNSEEEDENAEDYYGNDYPDDEVNSDDEYNEGVYNSQGQASEDEEFDNDVT